MNLQQIGAVVGLITGALYIKDALDKPPVPRCPECGLPQVYPSARYSKCPRCGRLMDWKVPQ